MSNNGISSDQILGQQANQNASNGKRLRQNMYVTACLNMRDLNECESPFLRIYIVSYASQAILVTQRKTLEMRFVHKEQILAVTLKNKSPNKDKTKDRSSLCIATPFRWLQSGQQDWRSSMRSSNLVCNAGLTQRVFFVDLYVEKSFLVETCFKI